MAIIPIVLCSLLAMMSSEGDDRPAVLVLTRTDGFRHASVEAGVAAIREMGEGRFSVEHTEDPAEFAPGNLSRFDAVVFLNTTRDVLGPSEENAFENYLREGGGWVGVHAAADTEYDWPFYGTLLGGAWFKTHPPTQEATIVVEDRDHPAVSHLPSHWIRTDEWFEYVANPRSRVHVLASLDESTYEVREGMGDHPIVWTVPVGGGAAIYTGGGHTEESFREPAFREHLLRCILWVIDDGFIDLIPESGHRGWIGHGWGSADGVAVAPTDARRLITVTGPGGIITNHQGGAGDLLTRSSFGDVALHVEFMIPEGGNSGIYLQDRYEIQILDSWGRKRPGAGDCGGLYERWDETRVAPGYEGTAPRVNASRKPGHWQSYDIIFRAPRFDDRGRKIANARLEEVRHNGILIHENVEITGPTRGGRGGGEVAEGPLRLQGDHGPVAYRNLRIKRLGPERSQEGQSP